MLNNQKQTRSANSSAIVSDNEVSLKRSAWLNLLKDVPVLHEDLLYIVLNYLCVIGCHEAAEEFTKESGAIPEMPLHSLALRQRIFNAILNGKIGDALEGVNQIDPLILELNPDTNFKLKQQQLNQIIEQRDDEAALLFAQKELAPCVNKHPHLLPQLEESMLKLAFPDMTQGDSSSSSTSERDEIARSVDDSVLRFYGVAKESVLNSLMKRLVWTQKRLLETSTDNRESQVPPIPLLMSPTISEFFIPAASTQTEE